MKIVSLKSEQFDNFASNHKYRNYYQTSAYGNLMSKFGYKSLYLGIINEENKLVGATLLLYKNAYMNYKYAYAPRGILYNYDNPEKINEVTTQLKNVLVKKKFMLFRMDPYIPLTIRDCDGNIMNFNNNGNGIIENLKAAGFTYKGKTLYFENEKPRWEALILLGKDIRELFSKFDKRTRNKIRKAANNGIEVTKEDKKDINKFYKYVSKKEHKPLSYYQELVNQFGENIDLYFAKINTETFVINSRRTYEKEIQYNDDLQAKIINNTLTENERESYINKKMESDKLLSSYKKNMIVSTDLLKENPNGIFIAGSMILKYDNAAYILSEGIDEKYNYINANDLIKWKLIEDYTNQGLKYINLNGIVGDFENKNPYSGLNESKLGYNSMITEYIGEFDIILNNVAYNFYNKLHTHKEVKKEESNNELESENN